MILFVADFVGVMHLRLIYYVDIPIIGIISLKTSSQVS
jgi:hypothetical protein